MPVLFFSYYMSKYAVTCYLLNAINQFTIRCNGPFEPVFGNCFSGASVVSSASLVVFSLTLVSFSTVVDSLIGFLTVLVSLS